MHRRLQQKKRQKAAVLAAAAAAAVIAYMSSHLVKTPQNTSSLTGHAWVRELLAGHPRRFHNMMGMSNHVFRTLSRELQEYGGLQNSKYIALEEQLALFLHMCRTGGSHRDMQE